MLSHDLQELRDLMQQNCIQKGDFVLASGLPARYYYDGKKVTLRPYTAEIIGRVVLELARDVGTEAVGGMSIGADPIATAVALASLHDGGAEMPAFIVRKEPKGHGTKEQTSAGFADDGTPLLRAGRKVLIVDDVITTGGSVLDAIKVVEGNGCQIVGVLALVERHEGGGQRLMSDGYNFLRLFYTNPEGDLEIDEGLVQRAKDPSRSPRAVLRR